MNDASSPAKTVRSTDRPLRPIRVGDVLNDIFEVKRYIAEGGMGEVFEGCNRVSGERVAIKVIRPSLAADPLVVSMFRREADTLTRLHHEAIVPYRLLAEERRRRTLYIVTAFIEGSSLSERLGRTAPESKQLALLMRRLASGLAAAHAEGVIHRDLSPDNVLLQDGRLDRAKIIDFGIAKNMDPGKVSLIGSSFAGKLNYVAPEQLGLYDREVGPWTDVYSLALVTLALVRGRDVGLGNTVADAMSARATVPDLSAVPAELRRLFGKMLQPNPHRRLRSMEAVMAELDRIERPRPATSRGWRKAALRWGPPALALAALAGLYAHGGRVEQQPLVEDVTDRLPALAEAQAEPPPVDAERDSNAAMAVEMVQTVRLPDPFVLLFDFESAQLTPEATHLLDQALMLCDDALAREARFFIVVTGFDAEPVPGLAERRTMAVRQYLETSGDACDARVASRITEREPGVEAADGVREPQARRVEVEFRDSTPPAVPIGM